MNRIHLDTVGKEVLIRGLSIQMVVSIGKDEVTESEHRAGQSSSEWLLWATVTLLHILGSGISSETVKCMGESIRL